jgi:glycerate kinase
MDQPLAVVVAPDSFKGSLDAQKVAAAMVRGWLDARPHDRVRVLPQADGGEGTLDAIAAAVPDALRHDVGPVTGPDGRPTPGMWLELPGQVGVVELAQSSGLPLMRTPDPLGATTRGLGDVIRHAMEHDIASLVVGLGGSASTDGGAGALSALGLGLLAADDTALDYGGAALAALGRIDKSLLLTPPPGGVTLLADVTAPLLGDNGAAVVFGPQKGADAGQIRMLERGLARFASLLGGDPNAAGSGAAGGTAYGFAAVWDARIESGAHVLQRLTGLTHAISSADVVLTGEGRFDGTSMAGKVVGELLALASGYRARVGIIAGQLQTNPDTWAISLTDLAGSASEAMADPALYLEEAGREAARHFSSTAP